jgi:hypothetical protein
MQTMIPELEASYIQSSLRFYRNAVMVASALVLLLVAGCHEAWAYTDEQVCDAIYIAEGGANTNHPYGILAHYKHTAPRQACLNTVAHARRDWNGQGDFLSFLAARYAPIGASNDPQGLNRHWLSNVTRILNANH